jgi:hypothetical protein
MVSMKNRDVVLNNIREFSPRETGDGGSGAEEEKVK